MYSARSHPRVLAGAAAVVGLFLAACDTPAPTAPPAQRNPAALTTTSSSVQRATSYSGVATVVDATVLGVHTVLVQAGPQPSTGGSFQNSLASASVPGLLTANLLDASTFGRGNVSQSQASLADLLLTVGGQTISASLVTAVAEAACTSTGVSLHGNSQIAKLVINGTPTTVSGSPNQTITLPLNAGSVIINEQIKSPTATSGAITVNALHVIVTGVADVIISHAHADIQCA